MWQKQVFWAGVALVAAPALAQTSTFINNGGVHEAAEYGSDTFTQPPGSVLDVFTFKLAAATGLESDVAFVGRPPLTGTVSLYADLAVDVLLGSYAFSAGSHSFGALAAGDYYYQVAATGSGGGGFTFGSYMVPIPEPDTYALMLGGLGLVGFLLARRKAS